MKTFFFIALFFCCTAVAAQIRLPKLIGDSMVLQRQTGIKLWGWAMPGEKVSLQFRHKQYSTTTATDSIWAILLPAQQAGGPYDMIFSASNSITVKNIVFGDVWVCSGQSNMEVTMSRLADKYPDIIEHADNPNIRQFEVPDRFDFRHQQKDVAYGSWKTVNPENILSFSAVAYFFAREIFSKYKIPIGLINTALGGSPAQAWISEEALRAFPEYYHEMQRFKNPELIRQIENADKKTNDEWYANLNAQDEGIKERWQDPDWNDAGWQNMTVPGYWADHGWGIINGAVWFRKTFDLAAQPSGMAKLLLGRIVDADSVFINGHFVGTTGYQYPPRRYIFPAALLKAGKNEVTVRVISNSGKGGWVPDKTYALVLGKDSIDLRGNWKCKLGAKTDPLPGQTFIRWMPGGLFNAMIAPLVNYPIKGVLWYQGEANTNNPGEYTALMQTLIGDWRSYWKQGNFPFIYVQLPNFMEAQPQPAESHWAELRQAQTDILHLVPNTGMAVTIDLGEWNDIHPLNKLDVGKRLALQAERLAYGDKNIIAGGPLIKSATREGNKLLLVFTGTGSGLVSKNSATLKGFAVCGEEGIFKWANASISGNKVMVWNNGIAHPQKVRYAWADNPAGANLYNKEGLPASPFEMRIP